MTEDELRIAVAVKNGWLRHREECWRNVELFAHVSNPRVAIPLSDLPNYTRSVDAIQEAVLSIDNFGFMLRYTSALNLIVLGTVKTEERYHSSTIAQFRVANASAIQRCEAFVRASEY